MNLKNGLWDKYRVVTVFLIGVLLTSVSSAQAVKIGDTLRGGVIASTNYHSKTILLVHLDQQQTRFIWNDAVNEITMHNDSTHENWRLPSLKELETLYYIQDSIPGLTKSTYWSSEVDATYDAYQDRDRRSHDAMSTDALDGTFQDYGSHRDEYVRTVNFHNGVIEWKKKSELNMFLRVREYVFER